ESNLSCAKSAIQAILSSREKIKRGVRWPVSEVVLVSSKEDVRLALTETSDLIASQINAKKVTVADVFARAKKSYKPDFAKIGPKFGSKSAQILAKFVTTPSLTKDIETHGKTIVHLDNEKIELNRDYFVVETSLPENWVSSEFANGAVYLNSETNKELEAEGFAREVMRKIQAMRKDAGLQRNDAIELFIDTSLKNELGKFENSIKEKCGAKAIKYSGSGKYKSTETIKNREFNVSFDIIR
ncbi:hypothetical protein JXB27_03995, partial [Candidatus Woesearchaeota archaeon]|nr:hypothetical protein [Candidatus Woesearchaeota archaeon]